MVNGHDVVYIESKGKLHLAQDVFPNAEALDACVKNLAQFVGKTITSEVARFDARLPDGSRVHVTLPPCSRNGVCMAIRKFSKVNFTIQDLVKLNAITPKAGDFLRVCVLTEKNLIVSGGTGSGKTSLLNAMSGLMPKEDRILVLEDSSELKLQQEHVLYYECVPGDRQGRGKVTIRDLFHSALRMRPTRVVIGEIRSGEALDLIQAMTSGHSGSMSTVHANTPKDALNRLETLCMMGGLEMPLHAIRTQVASAIDVIVQISRFRDGSRRLVEISEVLGLDDSGAYHCAPIFAFKLDGHDEKGAIRGGLEWSGHKPTFAKDVLMHGFKDEIASIAELFS